MENKEFEFENYKQKQAHFKRRCEERGKFITVSKYAQEYKAGSKGRSYTKPKKIIMKETRGDE